MLADKVGLTVLYNHVQFESLVLKTSAVMVVKQDERTVSAGYNNNHEPHQAKFEQTW